jgi:tRNA(Ile)-lysidine synthase
MLERYGFAHGLRWIYDTSNADTRHDRNFIRHRVLPTLQARWPSINRTLSRVAANQQDAAWVLNDVAAADYSATISASPGILSRTALVALAPARQRNVVRYWLQFLGLPMAGRVQIEAIVSDAAGGSEESSPCVRWPGAEVRRYRDSIYAMRPRSAAVAELHQPLAWDFKTPLEMREGRLSATRVRGSGLSACLSQQRSAEVRLRRGGERCRPAGCQYTRTLKKLFQERGVPPWERGRLPLIYVGGDLAAVADLWVCEPFAAAKDELGWLLSWRSAQ